MHVYDVLTGQVWLGGAGAGGRGGRRGGVAIHGMVCIKYEVKCRRGGL